MITEVLESILIRPRRGIAGLYPDVVIEESHEDGLEVTSHPVETGANISDHAYVKPASLTIRAGVSNASPLNAFSPDAAADFYAKLLELMRSREPFDVVTGKRLYKNMLLASLSAVTDAGSEKALIFTARLQEVILVNTRALAVPEARLHAAPGKTGAAAERGQIQAKEVNRSALDSLFG